MNPNDRLNAALWAKDILTHQPVILDTETTGLGDDDEIVQIAVIDHEGTVLMDTLVRPTRRQIPLEATQVHGITNRMVQNELAWDYIAPDIWKRIAGHHLVIYNASFDLRLMRQSCRSIAMKTVFTGLEAALPVSCAMLNYAQFFGEWNDYRQNYRWQSLSNAFYQQRLDVPDLPAHSALGDCIRTLLLIKHMATFAQREGMQS